MVYGYCRVSSVGQARDGNSLEDQTIALRNHGCEEIVCEAFSGKTMERPEFQKLIDRLQEGDTLVVTKLDRLSRTMVNGVETIRGLFERGIKVHILNMGVVENTLTGNLILQIMLSFCEFERGIIRERTQAGKAIARQRPDYREGRPKKYKPAQITHALELLNSGMSYKRVEEVTGISKSTLVRAKRAAQEQEVAERGKKM